MSNTRLLFIFFLAVVIGGHGCTLLRHSEGTASNPIVLDTMEIDFASRPAPPYQIPPTRSVDVLHMELDLRFNWEEEAVLGKAKLHLTAYNTPQDTVWLDARGFDIHALTLKRKDTSFVPNYTYDGSKIRIALDKPLKPKDTVLVSVHYTALPTELETTAGTAITSDQGLYFIHGDDDLGRPNQIWTQGEPMCNSSWFPSIDQPHEKLTHEIFLTVDSAYHSLSNGRLVYSSENGDGTRTDYWHQAQPHANYLVMIAVGEFAVVKDQWEDLPVWYYLDEKYESEAMAIFGNTPEMIGFYSNLLNYRYPWAKYHQVVVKDFVSGAMENTSAVVHGDFVQRSERELLDRSHEDVIAHELFHHWFGDLVTCESWSQLTMNEGFATYGEYLWEAHKYGPDEARYHLEQDLNAYLAEAAMETKPLIRNRYHHPDELFDSHTYQKGGRVIHMLRLELGDEMFFKALNHYLKSHQLGSVEVDQFRQSCEDVSGKDLRWFFDQWFDVAGHPEVDIHMKASDDTLEVSITQGQYPTFMLHIPIVISYEDGRMVTHNKFLSEKAQSFKIPLNGTPRWYAVDPDKDLLWEKTTEKPQSVWTAQLKAQTSYVARQSAMDHLASLPDSLVDLPLEQLMNDPFWLIRSKALYLAAERIGWTEGFKARLIEMTQLDEKSFNRAQAYLILDSLSGHDTAFQQLYLYGLKDKSYEVVSVCLRILRSMDPCLAADESQKLAGDPFGNLWLQAAASFAGCAKWDHHAFFKQQAKQRKGMELFLLNNHYITYVENMNEEPLYAALVKTLSRAASEGSAWWATYSAIQGLKSAHSYYESQIEKIEELEDATPEDLERLQSYRAKQGAISADINRFETGLVLPGPVSP